jgi:hypothetical protein
VIAYPPVCDHRVVPHRWVVFDRCNPSGAAADAGHEAAARVRGGLRVRRMTVLWTFRRPFMGRPVPRQLLRNALLDLGSSQGPQLEVYTLHSPLDAIQQC